MATLLRKPGKEYAVYYDKVPLEQVANSERMFPREWITPDGIDVTDDFLAYARPLIGDRWPAVPIENGLQRYAHFTPAFAPRKLPPYLPQAYRA